MTTLLLLIAGGYLILLGVIFLFQNKLLFMPSSVIFQTPQSVGLTSEELWIITEDGVRIHGWYFPNENAELVVILSHGNAGNISGRIGIAETLLNSGAAVVMYDYRGYGLSEGRPSESGFYKDIEAVVQYLKTDKEYDETDMVMYGRSLGGAVAAYAATKFDVRGLVLDSAFQNLRAMIRDVYPFVPTFLARYHFPTDEYLMHLEELPIMIMHSPNDDIVSYKQGIALYEMINQPKMFIELNGGHNDNFLTSRDIIYQSWSAYIRGLCNRCIGSPF